MNFFTKHNSVTIKGLSVHGLANLLVDSPVTNKKTINEQLQVAQKMAIILGLALISNSDISQLRLSINTVSSQ